MAKQSDFKISFSIDLMPYVAGLKSMLVMTQAAGKQIEPLLNLKLKAPDFTGFEKELVRLQEEVKATGVGAETMNAGIEDTGKKSGAAAPHVQKHGMAIRGMKREAMESFGALSFLAMNIVQMADSASGGSKELQKLSQGMSQGISAGFGLASTIKMIGIASGGTAVAIGAVVAIGVSLLSFFSNAEESAEAARKSLDNFSKSLELATSKDLELYIVNTKAAIKVQDDLIAGYQKELSTGVKTREAAIKLTNEINKADETRADLKEKLNKLEIARYGEGMNIAELEKVIQDARIASIKDSYDRQEAEAKTNAERQIENLQKQKNNEFESETAFETKRSEAILNIRKALAVKLSGINESEKKEIEQQQAEGDRKIKEQADKELQHQKLLDGIRAETQRAVLSGYKSKEMANAKSEVDKLVITERYAMMEIDLQEKTAKAYAGSEEEKTELTKKFDAMRMAIRKDTSAKYDAANKADIKRAQEFSEQQIEAWKNTHGAAMAAIDGITAGTRAMLSQFIIGNRQAADEWDAVWLTMRNTALQALIDLAVQQLKNALVNTAMAAASTAITNATMAAIIPTASAAATLVAIATLGVASGTGAASVIAALATVRAASIAGFEKGGKIKKGESGFIEGTKTEIIAPDDTFVDVARKELIPRAILNLENTAAAKITQRMIARSAGGKSNSDTSRLTKEIIAMRKAVENMPREVEFRARGNDLYATWDNQKKTLERLQY